MKLLVYKIITVHYWSDIIVSMSEGSIHFNGSTVLRENLQNKEVKRSRHGPGWELKWCLCNETSGFAVTPSSRLYGQQENHFSVTTCQIVMLTCQMIMLTCQISMLICQIIILTCQIIMWTCQIFMWTCHFFHSLKDRS